MIKEKLLEVTEQVRASLKPTDIISVDEAKNIIARYTAAVEGNFLAWMGAAVIYARSPQGEYAAKENLGVELKDNHQGMLRGFAKSAEAEPSLEHYQKVNEVVSSMRNFFSKENGLQALTVMATLEHTSSIFIPYLAELAEKRGSKNLRYTDIHGEADIEHAKQFIWAVESELKLHDNAERKIDQAIGKTLTFLAEIFTKK